MTITLLLHRLARGLALAGLLTPALLTGCSKPAATAPAASTTTAAVQHRVVEAACGECQFGMEGDSCDLAVRIDGKAYFVDGTGLDDHGDAHAADGLCNAIRHATVTGNIVGGRFKVDSFELLED